MTTFASALSAMVKLYSNLSSENQDNVFFVAHRYFAASVAVQYYWKDKHNSIVTKDLYGTVELPFGATISLVLNPDGTSQYTTREWPDMPPEVRAALEDKRQFDAVTLDKLASICSTVAPAPIMDSPSLTQKIFNLADAMLSWAKSGFTIAPEDSYKARKAICLACPEWNGEGYFGAGACKQCGCSGAKLYLASSECPLKKW